MAKRDNRQADLFEVEELFPVRAPSALPRALDFNRLLSAAMSLAIKQSPKSRSEIAAEMTEILGYEAGGAVTESMVNAYTSQARETHTISLVRFLAFARATDASWLWHEVLKNEGLTVLEGKQAHYARAGLMRKQAEELMAQARAEEAAAPTEVRVPRGRK